MAIPKKFWSEEAKEPAHKSIRRALMKEAGKDEKKMEHKKKKTYAKMKRFAEVAEHKAKGKGKIAKVMKEFSSGALHSGSKKGPMVKNKAQALAIGYSEAKTATNKAIIGGNTRTPACAQTPAMRKRMLCASIHVN